MGIPWSEARLRSFIVSTLRGATRRWPIKHQVLAEAKTEKKKNKKTKRLAQHFLCALCGKDFPASQISVDHKIPVIDPNTGFTTWDDFIKRLFCSKDNLQTLCDICHTEKTSLERKQKYADK